MLILCLRQLAVYGCGTPNKLPTKHSAASNARREELDTRRRSVLSMHPFLLLRFEQTAFTGMLFQAELVPIANTPLRLPTRRCDTELNEGLRYRLRKRYAWPRYATHSVESLRRVSLVFFSFRPPFLFRYCPTAIERLLCRNGKTDERAGEDFRVNNDLSSIKTTLFRW